MTHPGIINHVRTTTGYRTTLAFDLAPDVELMVTVLDDGEDPIAEECWVEGPKTDCFRCHGNGWHLVFSSYGTRGVVCRDCGGTGRISTTTTLLDDLTEDTRFAACVPRSDGWPDWLETAWVRMGEAA